MPADHLPHQPAYILIVEDSRTQAAILRRLLQQNGYEVEISADGQLALESVARRLPDLIISDILMPVMDGYEMCMALRKDPAFEDVPVMLLTTLVDASDIVRGLQVGADYYITKPYEDEYLLSTVVEILSQPAPPRGSEQKLEVEVAGKCYVIEAGRRRMLNLLLSTYGNAVQQNRVLLHNQNELRTLNNQLLAQRQQIAAQQRELEEINVRLKEQATHDGMTGLRNYRAFVERFNEEFSRSVRREDTLSLLLLDVDHFKSFNDTFGHPAGDDVLRQVATIMGSQMREGDLVARYGGEEFAILLPDTPPEAAKLFAARIGEAIAGGDWRLRGITVSIGIASTSPQITDTTILLAEADKALYVSKTQGRNRATHALDVEDEIEVKPTGPLPRLNNDRLN